MGIIILLTAPFAALVAPFSFIINSAQLFFEPFADVAADWSAFFAM